MMLDPGKGPASKAGRGWYDDIDFAVDIREGDCELKLPVWAISRQASVFSSGARRCLCYPGGSGCNSRCAIGDFDGLGWPPYDCHEIKSRTGGVWNDEF